MRIINRVESLSFERALAKHGMSPAFHLLMQMELDVLEDLARRGCSFRRLPAWIVYAVCNRRLLAVRFEWLPRLNRRMSGVSLGLLEAVHASCADELARLRQRGWMITSDGIAPGDAEIRKALERRARLEEVLDEVLEDLPEF